MSLLAGFDLVAEISNETIRKLLQQNLQIGGVSASPPFELNLPIAGSGASGTAHLIVNDLQLDLNADDTMTLTLSFDRTSVTTEAPSPLTVCPLDGSIAVTAALQLDSSQQVSINLGASTVAINWSAAANQEIANDLAGTAITPAIFQAFATQALTTFVQSVPAATVLPAFPIAPQGQNGSLTPSLQFVRLEVHCIPNADRSQQALGIFGILLVANSSNGDHNQKTSTAITAPNDGVCVSIAPGAFHSLIFCPAIANAFKITGQLPKTCGSAGSANVNGVDINSIADSFVGPTPNFPNGHIDIKGSASKSGFCYDADGTFHGTITLSVSGSTLTPTVKMAEPDIDVDIPWYCDLAAAVVFGPIGIAAAIIVNDVADEIASSLANDAIKGALGAGIPGVPVGGLAGASFNSVLTTTEGLTVQGTVPLPAPPLITAKLELSGSVITTQSEKIESGIYHFAACAEIGEKDYPYTEYSQQQIARYQPIGTLVTQPFTPHYAVSGDIGVTWKPLAAKSGTIELPNVKTYYPTPGGGQSIQQSVHIGYSISDTTIEFTNEPLEGCYIFYVRFTATDCDGDPVQDSTHQLLVGEVAVWFEGERLELDDNYQKDVLYCATLQTYQAPSGKPGWIPVDKPDPHRLVEYIRDVVAIGGLKADRILLISKIAHGNSFLRALASPAAQQPSLLKVRDPLAANQRQLANIARELMNLSQRFKT